MPVLIEPALIILERDRNAADLKWHAWWGDRMLCHSSPQPEHDACRALLVLGYSGKIRTRHQRAPHDAMTMGIAWGARRTAESGYFKVLNDADYEAALAAARAFPNIETPPSPD